ncbi:MAG: HK97 family phage prohead protease [Betaproteobacteria bacterium]|jgi:HK97 family phage prohead protease
MDRKSIDVGFQVKALSDDGMIEGYGSVFGVRDSYSDIVAAGAFKSSLAAHKAAGTMPALLWQHRSDEPIGVWTSMVEDQKGLAVVGQLAMDTTRGREAHALLKMRAINGLSIGFYSKEWKYDTENDVRTLTEVDLWETSLVTFPSNSAARVTAVKSIEKLESLREVEMMLRDRGFTKTEAVALVSKIKGMRPGDPVSPDGGPGDPVAELVVALKRRGSALA